MLAATDPANVYGAALAWPGGDLDGRGGQRPRRSAGAYVVLIDGDLILWVGKGGASVLTFTAEPELLEVAVGALAADVQGRRLPALQVKRIDGRDVGDQPLLEHLRAAGFADHPRGLVLRPRR